MTAGAMSTTRKKTRCRFNNSSTKPASCSRSSWSTASTRDRFPVTVPDIHRPGLALAGFMQNYLNERIQILGETEILYLNTRAEDVRHEAVERLFSVPLVCIIVTRSLDIPGRAPARPPRAHACRCCARRC